MIFAIAGTSLSTSDQAFPFYRMKQMYQRIFVILCACLFTIGFADQTQAQRGGFDVEGYLKRIDRNQNGRLEEDEMNGRTKDFIRKMGIDVDRPVSIKKVVAKVNKDRERRETEAKKKNAPELKVPGFAVATEEEGGGVLAFGVSAESGSSSSSSRVKKVEFSDSVNRQITDALNRYDKNKDGILDAEEIKNGRWGNPKPSESDLNKDGRLTRDELGRRYIARESYYNRERNKSSSSSNRSSTSSSRSSRSSSSLSRSRTPSRSSMTRTSTASANTSKAPSSTSTAKYERYASSLIRQYDKNKNGKLEKEEVAEMRRPPKADANKDGVITKEELMDSLTGKKSSSGTGDSEKESSNTRSSFSKTKSSSSSRFSRSRRSSSFGDLDKNQDGMVHMHEFASDWTEELVDEFNAKDRDGDGHITEQEWTSK